MRFTFSKGSFSCKYQRIIFKYIAPVSVILQSLVLGTIAGWPVINIPKMLSSDWPVQMTEEEISWTMTSLFFGNMLSPIPAGYLMDKYGRKSTLLHSSVLPIATWLLVGVGNKSYHLWSAWFLAGLWNGIVYTVVPVYLGEITDAGRRGFVNTIFSVARRIGIVLQYILGSYINYRTVALFVILLPILFILSFVWAPESPYHHLMKNDKTSAAKALGRLRGKSDDNNGKGGKEIESELDEIEVFVLEEMTNRGGFKDLISTGANRRALLIVETVIILSRISETGSIMGYITATLPKNIFNSLGPSQCVVIIESIRFATGLVSSILIDRIGRKILMFGSSITSGIVMLVSGLWYFLNTDTDMDVSGANWLPFMCLMVHSASHCLGLGPVSSSLRSEYFPMSVKAKSSAITSTTVALVACVVNKTFLTTADRIGVYFNYWIFSSGCFLNAIFTAFFVTETKGKTLRDIQDRLKSGDKKSLSNGTTQKV